MTGDTMCVVDYSQTLCTCPAIWFGTIPPHCPIHNPDDYTWTITTTDSVKLAVPKPTTEKGWECPRCTRINAPGTPWCCKADP